jgi:thiol-disulfide isomerase/thioredoxin
VTGPARVVLGVVLVAASGPAGFLAYRLLQAERPAAPLEARSTPSAPPQAANLVRHRTPEQLPELKLPDVNGASRSLSQWRGHPLLVNFWATWCAPCRKEIPLLKTLRHRRSDLGLEVVGVAVDFRDAVVPYVKELQIDYPVLIGEEGGLQAIDALGVDAAFPFTVLADPQGRIVALKIGELHPDEADLMLSRVADLDAGRVDLAEARRQIRDGLSELAMQRAKHTAAEGAEGAKS